MTHATVGQLLNSRGQQLATAEYLPTGKIEAAVIFFHGMTVFAERDSKGLIAALVPLNMVVYTMDHHGHGKSEPLNAEDRCFLERFDNLVDDGQLMIDMVAKAHPSVPLFLVGHSMGGLTSLHLALHRQKDLAGVVAIAPACGVGEEKQKAHLAAMSNLLLTVDPRARIIPFRPAEDLSNDPQVNADHEACTQTIKGQLPVGTIHSMLQGMYALQEQQATLTLPIYAVHGTCDHVVTLEATQALVAGASSTDKTMVVVEGAFHEILLGAEKEDVVAGVVAWLTAHVATSA